MATTLRLLERGAPLSELRARLPNVPGTGVAKGRRVEEQQAAVLDERIDTWNQVLGTATAARCAAASLALAY